jgi:ryanodine receptor 2
MACFRMAPLYSIPLHRAINLFIKSYKHDWLDDPDETVNNIGSLIPDLCMAYENTVVDGSVDGGQDVSLMTSQATAASPSSELTKDEQTTSEGRKDDVDIADVKQQPDSLRQLITAFNRAATTEQQSTSNGGPPDALLDSLYMAYAEIMSKSCEIDEDDDDNPTKANNNDNNANLNPGDQEEEEEEDQGKLFQEQEMAKQKLLYEQGRLAERGAAEMALLYISASKGNKTDMLDKTLQLGISLLHGGNVQVQQRMLKHLKEKRDAEFFTSIAGLMANCSVLDLDTFERCTKAEAFGGVSPSSTSTPSNDANSGVAGKRCLDDADFTCSLFRFLQLLCEGHNLEFQNYLRTQTGNNTIVNIIICTVDYLLRLQESIMDFYWHYSGKSTVDLAGKENFCRAIVVAKQVFNTLTEYIQGPCVGNQLTLAHSRLWDAIGGFLYIFSHLQDKLSKDPGQIELLRELMTLQKDMIIMLLSMLEGNVLNGPIGKQMVDTLIENQPNVEMLLKFFDIFLKMKDLTSSDAFQEYDTNADGWISPKEFRMAMEAQKVYTYEEIDYILMCVDTNHDGKIDFKEFTERFHNPAKDIGFNMAVLLTNLSEHMSHDVRLDRLMKKASSFLSYFEPFLGRIEIAGSSQRIERVYFEISESNIEQWNKPQIKESKRQFLYDIVNEGDDKEKLEQFVNFCEDTIFEMQHAATISAKPNETTMGGKDDAKIQQTSIRAAILEPTKSVIGSVARVLSPTHIQASYSTLKNMGVFALTKFSIRILISLIVWLVQILFVVIRVTTHCAIYMMSGQEVDQQQQQHASGAEQTHMHAHHQDPSGSPKQLALTYVANNDDKSNVVVDHDTNDHDSIAKGGGPVMPNHSPVPKTMTHPVNQAKPTKTSVNDEPDDESNVNGNGKHGPSSGFNLKRFRKNLMETFARNFYKLKYLALALAFLINFFMLFYKAIMIPSVSLADDGAIETTNTEESSIDELEEQLEVIMMDADRYYFEYILKILAFTHSLVSFAMLIAYYVLKVPLVIFKREKEIARKLEFQGMWIVEQPSDDDIRSHWDKLVIGTRTYPDMYWDRFIKKKVKSKYMEQFDVAQLNKLLGINASNDVYKFENKHQTSGSTGTARPTGFLYG